MRSGFRSESGPRGPGEGGPVELVRLRRAQRDAGDAGYRVRGRSRRRGGRGRRRGGRPAPAPKPRTFLDWLKSLLGIGGRPRRPVRAEARGEGRSGSLGQQEARVLAEFGRQYGIEFRDPVQLKLALTHRSYLSVTGQGPRESNERLEFLGDSVLGLVTSEYLYRRHPDEHEGQLTKTKSLLVSKAILSRRALRMGLGRFVLMSHSEVESGGRQRLSILADAFEAVLGAIYLDQGFEVARQYIHRWLLDDSDAIVADKRHTNYKSHLQEYVQSTYRTHPVYRIRSEYGPDHSKHFMVEVLVGRRTLGEGRGHNKKEAEQAAARDAIERVEKLRRDASGGRVDAEALGQPDADDAQDESTSERRRRRRGRRGRSRDEGGPAPPGAQTGTAGPGSGRVVIEEYESAESDVADEDGDLDQEGPADHADTREDSELESESGAGAGGAPDEEEFEFESDDDDDEDEPAGAGPAAEHAVAPPPSVPGAAGTSSAGPGAPVVYGRSSRRTRAPLQAPAPAAPPPAGEETAREELAVDPFGYDERTAPDPARGAPEEPREERSGSATQPQAPAPAAESRDREEAEANRRRAEEIERAMANFGRRDDGPGSRFGRRGRRGR